MTFEELLQRLGDALWPGCGHWSLHRLESALMQISQELWLMLDDFPRGVESGFDTAFGRLLALQGNVVWWITSRRRPACNLPRLMLQGDLLELGVDELAFSAADIKALLGSDDSCSTRADEILAQSQGWCAAVAFSMRPGVDVRSTLLEYLHHELLNELDGEDRDKLICLSNFSAFDEELCEHLFGMTPGGSHLSGALVDRTAIFTAADASPGRIQVLQPIAALLAPLLGPEMLRPYRRLACQYYLQQGERHLAIEQALLVEQYDVAASLLEQIDEAELLQEQRVGKVISYRAQLPKELWECTPKLARLYAYAYAMAARPHDILRCLAAFDKFLPPASAEDQIKLTACWQGLRGVAAHFLNDQQTAFASCAEALEHIAHECWPLRLSCWAVLIQHRLFRGELGAAESLVQQALRFAHEVRSEAAECFARLYQSFLMEARGELRQAQQVVDRQLRLMTSHPTSRPALQVRLIVRHAQLSLRLGSLQAANLRFAEAHRLATLNADAVGYQGLVGLSTLALLSGDISSALEHLEHAEHWLRDNDVAESVYRSVINQRRAEALIERGDWPTARSLLTGILQRHGDLASPASVQAYERPDFLYETHLLLARTELQAGRCADADERLRNLADQALNAGLRLVACDALLLRAEVAFEREDKAHAQMLYSQAVQECERLEYRLPLERLSCRNPRLVRSNGGPSTCGLLSQREIEVLRLVEEGYSNQEIADHLRISLFTVKSHLQRLSGKLDVKRRTQAVSKAKSLGLI
ncbi:LuxR C-terminal-related transcriptional regulator [Pseudomonas guguanensis]|uniref:LuxR C-terminal-related transcriptional regulator n=1 Tax=Ectopseudomonas guguanensis TaxID=1198456 RepID=UPI0032642757